MVILLLLFCFPVVLNAQPLTLEQCIERALRYNLDVRVAEQAVVRSVADVKASRAERLPSVNATLLSVGRSRTGSSVRIQDNPGVIDEVTGDRIFQEEVTVIPANTRESFAVSTSLTHTFYDAGRRTNRHRSSQFNLDSSESSLKSRQADVVADVKERYFELLKALELVEVRKESLKLSEKQLEDAQVRLEVGSGTEVDVLRLQVQLDNARAELINVEQSVARAKAQLNHVIGAEVHDGIQVAELAEDRWEISTARDDLSKLIETARAGNPSLAGMRQSVSASEHALKAARAAWYPRLGGNIGYSRNNEVFDRVYENLDQNYSLNMGLSLTYNVFDGGVRQANIDRSRVELETARMNRQKRERELDLAIEVARLEMIRLEKLIRLGEQTVKLAKEDLRLAEERYRVGIGRLLEVLDAQVGFTRERANLVQTRYDLKIAEAGLLRELGSW